MNILILGAGRVGSSLAEHLAQEDENKITIVDIDQEKLDYLTDKVDVQTILGEASHPQTLISANCEVMDLMIAVSRFDEMNMIACKIAHKINPKIKKICRVRAQEYWDYKHYLDRDSHNITTIDSFISPHRLVTNYIERLIETPGALQSVSFADGKLRLVAVKTREDGLLVGKMIKEIKGHIPEHMDARIVAIYRNNSSIFPDGNTIIENGDEVFFMAENSQINTIMSELRKAEKPIKRITIAGAGLVGYRLAASLEKKTNSIKIIDLNKKRLEEINPLLKETVCLYGDASDPQLMLQEHISESDAFIAVTSSDGTNILSCMLAKSLKAKKVMALVNQPEYVSLLEDSQIDVAISPDQITISSILKYVRQGNTAYAHPLRKGAAEALEMIINSNSPVINKRLDEIDIPYGITIGAIVRDGDCIIAHRHICFKPNDHVVLFMTKNKLAKKVKKIFGSDSL